jgi:hypothetical protein
MSDTIKKIEGWADGITATREPNEIASITLFTDKRFSDLHPALLLVSTDDKMPEVVTKAEAQAKDADILWAMTWMSNEAAHLREMGQPQPALEIAIKAVCERHGITL